MEKIIVTGSDGLLGREICNHLEDEGHKIIYADLKQGCDFTDEKYTKLFFKHHSGEKCLINLFAMNDHVIVKKDRSDLFNVPICELNDFLNVNVCALFSVCREYARNNKTGNIINFSSIYGLVSPQPKMYDGHKHIGYCVSKAGVIEMTKYLAVHLAPNFRVNCIVPGGVEHNQGKKFIEEYSKRTPMQRMLKKQELNPLIDYLLKDTYATGSAFVVDGGWTAW